jgi:hypothetical protein
MELEAALKNEVAKVWAALDAPARRGFWARLASVLRGLVV